MEVTQAMVDAAVEEMARHDGSDEEAMARAMLEAALRTAE